jgi:translation elongation factor EF-Ts
MNKGGAMVRVTAQTDFACKTDIFIAFAKRVAMMAYAASSAQWSEIIAIFPDLEEARLALESKTSGLGEKVTIQEVVLLLPEGSNVYLLPPHEREINAVREAELQNKPRHLTASLRQSPAADK